MLFIILPSTYGHKAAVYRRIVKYSSLENKVPFNIQYDQVSQIARAFYNISLAEILGNTHYLYALALAFVLSWAYYTTYR